MWCVCIYRGFRCNFRLVCNLLCIRASGLSVVRSNFGGFGCDFRLICNLLSIRASGLSIVRSDFFGGGVCFGSIGKDFFGGRF